MLGYSLHNLALLKIHQNAHQEAATLLAEAMSSLRDKRQWFGVALVIGTSGWAMLREGQYEAALEPTRQSLDVQYNAGDLNGTVDHLKTLAEIAVLRGQYERAAILYGAEETLRDSNRLPFSPFLKPYYYASIKLLISRIGNQEYMAA